MKLGIQTYLIGVRIYSKTGVQGMMGRAKEGYDLGTPPPYLGAGSP